MTTTSQEPELEFPPPHNRTDTSRRAAELSAANAKTQRAVVYAAILNAGPNGRTLPEIEDLLGLSGNSVRPRLWELRGKPAKSKRPVLVVDSGERRRVRGGRTTAKVWVAASVLRGEAAR